MLKSHQAAKDAAQHATVLKQGVHDSYATSAMLHAPSLLNQVSVSERSGESGAHFSAILAMFHSPSRTCW